MTQIPKVDGLESKLVAFHMSREQLRSQKEDLRNTRNQASFSAALNAAIATIFLTVLASSGLDSSQVYDNAIFYVALVCMLGSLVFSILAISDWKVCHFDQSAHWVFEKIEEGNSDVGIIELLAKEAEVYFDENEEIVQEVRNRIWWSSVLAWTQAVAWIFVFVTIEWK